MRTASVYLEARTPHQNVRLYSHYLAYREMMMRIMLMKRLLDGVKWDGSMLEELFIPKEPKP